MHKATCSDCGKETEVLSNQQQGNQYTVGTVSRNIEDTNP